MRRFHRFQSIPFFVLCLIILLLPGCVSAPWGAVPDGAGPPERDELLRLFESRREAGVVESRARIARLVAGSPSLYGADAEAANAAERGELAVASAAWWGWDGEDATPALEKALKAPVDLLLIPAMPGDWLTGPVEIDGPREVLIEPGAVIRALPGAFLGRKEYLLTAYRVDDLTISGYGARLVMRKEDYVRPPYVWSQWRHALAILESTNIVVEGLSIERSGGDGVYIGQHREGVPSRNIRLTDLDLLQNHRQGVSVISVDGFLMEYAYIAHTRGVPPSSAIDFEPNSGLYGLTDCRVRYSLFERNAGAALTIFLRNMNADHPPVDIAIEDSLILGYPLSTFIAGTGNGVRGTVRFSDTGVAGIGIARGSRMLELMR